MLSQSVWAELIAGEIGMGPEGKGKGRECPDKQVLGRTVFHLDLSGKILTYPAAL